MQGQKGTIWGGGDDLHKRKDWMEGILADRPSKKPDLGVYGWQDKTQQQRK